MTNTTLTEHINKSIEVVNNQVYTTLVGDFGWSEDAARSTLDGVFTLAEDGSNG